MKKISRSHHSSLNELNITPLLDLAFVLLVIFIITTPQLSNDLEMNLPSPKQNTHPSPPPKINYVGVDDAGHFSLNQKSMDLPELKQSLAALKASDADASVVVKGAANVDYQKVISVLDVLQTLDITKVGLATETTP